MVDWRALCREKRLTRQVASQPRKQAVLKVHAPDGESGRSLCGKRVLLALVPAAVTCQTCLTMRAHGPSITRVLKEKARLRLLKTVAW